MDNRDHDTMTTSSLRVSVAESALAKACSNQLVVAAMIFAEVQMQKRQRSINTALEPLRLWFEGQAHILRSVDQSVLWLAGQLKGGFFLSLAEVLGCLREERHLHHVGILCPRVIPGVAHRVLSDADLESEDVLCVGMADLAICAVGARLCRNAFLVYGYSCRSVLWLDEDTGLAQAEVAEFTTEWRSFQALAANEEGHAGLSEVTKRSQFSHVCVQQLAAALGESDCSTTPSGKLKAMTPQQLGRILVLWQRCAAFSSLSLGCLLKVLCCCLTGVTFLGYWCHVL